MAGNKHIVVENAEGSSPTAKWHTTETYKVTGAVADELAAMPEKPKGAKLQEWVVDHGGVLDDFNGKAARRSMKKDGTVLSDHYKNGKFKDSDVTHPKGHDSHAGAELLLFMLTGGTSLFIPHGDGSKPAATATASADDKKTGRVTAKTATARPKPD